MRKGRKVYVAAKTPSLSSEESCSQSLLFHLSLLEVRSQNPAVAWARPSLRVLTSASFLCLSLMFVLTHHPFKAPCPLAAGVLPFLSLAVDERSVSTTP